ncbi:MAG: adenylate/guanylate cyclase domain-containing protein [Myxococcota bacterium]|nr:adenylate/guanylate cyclase domain-containing protein [Myxococcota bacterium]
MTKPVPHSPEARETLRRFQHELRTPLGQIIGYSELLVDEVRDRAQDDLVGDLEKIRDAAKKLLSMMEETLSPGSAEGAGEPEAAAPGPAGAVGRERPAGLAGEPDQAGPPGRILVVDDDPGNVEILARRLVARGHQVDTVTSGPDALHRIEQQIPDLVILDILMPGMSGLEVLDAIRSHHSLARLPVVMATALSASEDVTDALARGANDYVTKPFDMPVVLARLDTQLRYARASRAVESLARQLEVRNAFIRNTFGRYVSQEVASQLLEKPDALDIRGERRRVSILVADIRGFSHLTETLAPTAVVRLLNNYLEVMSEVIAEHGGVVDDFAGDGILALFGAPILHDDEERRAVSCAIRMQLAIERVNRRNGELRLPHVEMGIGIATGEVIVGNIGSSQRTEYTAIGSAVNLASRIESYSAGGDVWIADETLTPIEAITRVDEVRTVRPKGFDQPLAIHRVVGIEGDPPLALPVERARLVTLARPLPIRFSVLVGKHVAEHTDEGRIVALSEGTARVEAGRRVEELSDLRLEIPDTDGASCYGKVVEDAGEGFTLRFTSRSDEAAARLARELLESRA